MKIFLESLAHALDGLGEIFRNERNFRVQAALGLLALFLGTFLRVTATEFAVLLICIGMVLSAEAMNSAVERFVDSMVDKPDERAKRAKDAAASAALICALCALACGGVIFVPKLINLFYRR